MDNKYKEFIKKILEMRMMGLIRHRDITVLNSVMLWLDFEREVDIKNKRIVMINGMDKADVSKSIKKLKEMAIIIEGEIGYKLNDKIVGKSNLEIE